MNQFFCTTYFLCLSSLAFCQTNTVLPKESFGSVQPIGGGEFQVERTECLSPAARATIQRLNDENIERLERQGEFRNCVNAPCRSSRSMFSSLSL